MLAFVLRPVREVLRAPFTRRTWAEVLYLVAGLPFAAVTLVAAAPLLLGAPLVVIAVGMPLVAATLVGARWLAGIQRELAAALLGERIDRMDRPRPAQPRPGFAGWLDATLHDRRAWRAIGYFAAKLPLALVGNYALVVLLTAGSFDLMYPLVWEGPSAADDGLPLTVVSVHTRGGTWVVSAIGTGLLLLVPWVVRPVVALDRSLVRRLLGPVTLSERVRVLEATRAHAVDQSTAQLRRIERDLHDGAQIRLAALAMTLGQIKEELQAPGGGSTGGGSVGPGTPGVLGELTAAGEPGAPGAGTDRTRALVEAAHRNAKEALVELRDLVQGIHPPVLDTGLEPALASLAGTSPIPATVAVDLPDRPSPSIEAIAYFCAAELVANVAKHSRADRVTIEARATPAPAGRAARQDEGPATTGSGRAPDRLRLTVTDDGSGGAHLRPGGGLAGLVERAGTVDGRVEIDSPSGGPTTVTVELPLQG